MSCGLHLQKYILGEHVLLFLIVSNYVFVSRKTFPTTMLFLNIFIALFLCLFYLGKSINKTENPSKLIAIIAMSKNRNSTTLTHEEYKRRKILVYAFNLSSIPATESLVRTELRLNGLRNFAEKENIRRNWIPKSWSAKAAVYESNKFLSNGTTKVSYL